MGAGARMQLWMPWQSHIAKHKLMDGLDNDRAWSPDEARKLTASEVGTCYASRESSARLLTSRYCPHN